MGICFRSRRRSLACAVVAKRKTTLDWRFLFLLPIPVLWCVAGHYGWFQFLEERTVDWRFRFRGEIAAPVKVVYVDIDSRTIDEIGNWPWSRGYFARVSDVLINTAHARAVGFDFVFSTNGQAESADRKKLVEGDLEFGRFLVRGPPAFPPVVLGASFTALEFRAAEGKIRHRTLPLVAERGRDATGIEPPEVTALQVPGRPSWTPPNLGLIDTIEGGTRTVPVWAPSSTGTFFHTAVQLARLYWGMPLSSLKLNGDHLDFVWPDGRVQARVPMRDRQLVDINWFSPWISKYNPRESFSVVYEYAQMLRSDKAAEHETAGKYFAQEEFKDAVVLIGPVDLILQDVTPTPVDDDPVPRVGVHGNLLKTIVSGLYLRSLPEGYQIALTLVLTLVVAGLAVSGGARSLFWKTFAVLALAFYFAAAFEVFKRLHFILPLAVPLSSAFSTSFAALIWQVVNEQRQKGRIKDMFGTYLSPAVVNHLVDSGKDPELGGHDAEITAYFSDIQEFSSFSEVLPAAKLGELLNEYLSACTDIVQGEGGMLDKFIGDAVVAMYGAPVELSNHAFRACVATQLVQRKIVELQEKWKSEGDRWPPRVHHLRTRIGLNTGSCMIGNMGSQTRFNYTMMGDNVNLAARMESGAKSWGVYTMVTESTRLACEQFGAGRLVFRPLGRIRVKGRAQAVPIHEILGLKEDVTDRTHECAGLFAQGLENHYARDFAGAVGCFQRSAELEERIPGRDPGVHDNPSLVYIAIARHYHAEPPPGDWDGVYVMKEK